MGVEKLYLITNFYLSNIMIKIMLSEQYSMNQMHV